MKKIKLKTKNIIRLLSALTFIVILIFIITKSVENLSKDLQIYYIAGNTDKVDIYDLELNKKNALYRGTSIVKIKDKTINDTLYTEIIYENEKYYIKNENLQENIENIIYEDKLYVRTPVTVYQNNKDNTILGYIEKGNSVDIIGYSGINNGIVSMYKIAYQNKEGYIYSKYLVETKEGADKLYPVEGLGNYTKLMDYYPYEKGNFKDNIMPEEVRAIYLNGSVLDNIDSYIELANNSEINAFVIDIKENTYPLYKSKVMEKYSITSYNKASKSIEYMKNILNKLKQNNIYAIARIVVGKDTFYGQDNPNDLITYKNGNPYIHNSSTWVSMYSRRVCEYNVSLAKEAVDLGFNEIQFDYLRFPDSSNTNLDFKNTYNESEKAVAIQNFLFYAVDEIHKKHAYVSADVFGECAHGYITGYGQYFAAISNVVDVISAMPYPELFASYEYGIKYPWNEPYNTLKSWGNYVVKQQSIIKSPAIVRTWIQAYTASWRSNYINYTNKEIEDEIRALYDLGFRQGFIAWNGGSSLNTYKSYIKAFNGEY